MNSFVKKRIQPLTIQNLHLVVMDSSVWPTNVETRTLQVMNINHLLQPHITAFYIHISKINITLITISRQISDEKCILEGKEYEQGESRLCSDGCNTCTCTEGGNWMSTLMACKPLGTINLCKHYTSYSLDIIYSVLIRCKYHIDLPNLFSF